MQQQFISAPCLVGGCEGKTANQQKPTYCHRHRYRLRRYGDLNAGRDFNRNAIAELAALMEGARPDRCLVFKSTHLSAGGYPKMWVEGRRLLVQRYVCERFNGEIPDGFHVDHVCGNILCVNRFHLEAVLPEENYRRRRVRNGWQKQVRHCRTCQCH